MALDNGTPLGPYEILEPLPSAGSERYKATDTRSHRLVAITVLPHGFSSRAKERLERNAREIASLGHSDISGPIDIGQQETIDYVVAEFVDGETLAERLKRGRIPVPESLDIAARLAESLDQAHRRGVVHGDLSPAMVMLTDDGPKLMDFGVARIIQDSGVEDSAVKADSSDGRAPSSDPVPPATLSTAPTQSLALSSLTTAPANAPYMAPERLAGANADARADIYAVGAVLYEMLTGRPAFVEKTPALLVAAIQTVEADAPSAVEPAVPAALDHLVARCLAKDPAERVQTARDLVRQLRWVAEVGSQIEVASAVAGSRRNNLVMNVALGVGIVLAVVLAPAAWRSFGPDAAPEAVRFTIPEFGNNPNAPLTVSPDGRWIAGTPGGVAGLVAYELDSVTPQFIVEGDIVFQPFWSPDSQSIAFFTSADNMLRRVDLAGGSPTTITEVPPPRSPGGWSRDGVILVGTGGVIQRVMAAGGDLVPVTTLDTGAGETEHAGPSFLPDGRHFLYTAVGTEDAVYVGSLDSPDRIRLFAADSKARYAEPGYIVFNRDDALFAQPFDADALELTGEPIRIEDGLTLLQTPAAIFTPSMNSWANFDVSQTGVLAFKVGNSATSAVPDAPSEARVLEWIDTNGQSTPVGPMESYTGILLSPDAESAAFHLHNAEGGDIWTFDFAEGRMQRLTFDASQHSMNPVWSPDSERIAYVSADGLYVRQADGSGDAERIVSGSGMLSMSWSSDGLIVYWQAGDVWAVPVDGDRQPFVVLDSQSNEMFATVSPAGGWIAYQSDETGVPEIYVKQFPEGATRRQVSVDGGTWPEWRADGNELYFSPPGSAQILAVGIDIDGDSLRPGVPRPAFQFNGNPNLGATHPRYRRYAVSADGQRILVSRPGGGGADAAGGGGLDLAVRNAAGANGITGTGLPIPVILNWPELLAGR